MIIFPAIDIKDGKVVRLSQGNFNKVTEYDDDPIGMAQKWIHDGARWLHIIDLDGAKLGIMRNHDIILYTARNISVPCQVGGGIRDKATVEKLITGGVQRVIIGTKALEDDEFLRSIVTEWPENIAVSLDCKDGYVATHGWVETSKIKAVDCVKKLEDIGVQCVIYTDIACDGMLSGPNYNRLNEMLETTNIPIIASGGVSSIEDIRNLKALESKGLIGAITGKALYDGKLNLIEALKVC